MNDDQFQRLTAATREADELFESGNTGGGGTRHWLRDCFLPALESHGLQLVDAKPAATEQPVSAYDYATEGLGGT